MVLKGCKQFVLVFAEMHCQKKITALEGNIQAVEMTYLFVAFSSVLR